MAEINVIQNIGVSGFIFCALLLILPFLVSYYFKLGIIKKSVIIVSRMSFQLFLIGLLLTVVFDINNPLINILWIFVMLFFATYTILEGTDFKTGPFLPTMLLLFSIANILVLFYFTGFIIKLDDIFEARYLIPIAGMLMGNSLRANIVALNDFYHDVKNNEQRYLYRLCVGASRKEALFPYMQRSMLSSLKPTLANMATMGIVFLPGMMTGQILGGVDPILAIKYQITIMIAIFVTTVLGVLVCVIVVVEKGFDDYDLMVEDIKKV